MAMLSRIPEGDKWLVDGSQTIECASPEDADRLEAIVNEQSDDIARLQAECDSLAAENRVMHGVMMNLRTAFAHGGAFDPQSTGLYDPRLNAPHTAREVERVKRLERFAAEWSRQRKQMQGEGVTGREYRTLYILWKLAMGKELTTNEADDYAALDKLKGGE